MVYTGYGMELPTFAVDGDEFEQLSTGKKYIRIDGEWTEVGAPSPAPIEDTTTPVKTPVPESAPVPAPSTTRKRRKTNAK